MILASESFDSQLSTTKQTDVEEPRNNESCRAAKQRTNEANNQTQILQQVGFMIKILAEDVAIMNALTSSDWLHAIETIMASSVVDIAF